MIDIPLWIVWLVAAIVFFLGEVFTDGFFLLWFAVGALVGLFTTLFTDNVVIQFLFFIITSLVLLLSTQKLTKNFLNKRKPVESNVNALIGKSARVIEALDPIEGAGKVKINGEVWKAVPADNSQTFEIGETVVIKDIDGVKLIITK